MTGVITREEGEENLQCAGLSNMLCVQVYRVGCFL